MVYRDLREFIAALESRGELKRIALEVDPRLEMTEICDRVLKLEGPALLFEKPVGFSMPVLGNLFGTPTRVALGEAPRLPPAARTSRSTPVRRCNAARRAERLHRSRAG